MVWWDTTLEDGIYLQQFTGGMGEYGVKNGKMRRLRGSYYDVVFNYYERYKIVFDSDYKEDELNSCPNCGYDERYSWYSGYDPNKPCIMCGDNPVEFSLTWLDKCDKEVAKTFYNELCNVDRDWNHNRYRYVKKVFDKKNTTLENGIYLDPQDGHFEAYGVKDGIMKNMQKIQMLIICFL